MKALWLVIGIVLFTGPRGHGAVRFETGLRATGEVVQLTEEERAWVKAHPEVRWGFDPDWAPFSSFDRNQRLMGIDVDITRRVAERVGLTLKVVAGASWSEVLANAKAGEVDFLSGTARAPERFEFFDYSNDYGAFPVVVIMRTDAPFLILDPKLPSFTISAVRDHVLTGHLRERFPTVRFILTDSTEQAIKLVAKEKVDGTLANLAVATRVIRVNGLTNLKIVGVTRYEFPLHFAVRKDAPELTAILNKGLATITSDELEGIYAAHLTPDVAKARDWGMWRRRALYGALVGLIAVGMVACWNRFLAWQLRQRKAAEASLSVTAGRLERRTAELDLRVAEVEKLNLELQTANRDLESFSGSVSHDLRGPLRRITSYAQMVQTEAGACLKDKPGEWMSIIINEARRLDRLIYDLLEFARLGRAELRKQPVNMLPLVKSTIEDFQPQLRSRDVVWKVGELGEVDGDPNLLRYAMTNLIDNALKYTRREPHTEIKIDVLANGAQKRETVLYVKDNGCGFDMSQAGKLFAPFQRLHSYRDFEGTGIGLANVQKIIQRHGGRIWFESEPNKGATFYFTLPRWLPGDGTSKPNRGAASIETAEAQG